MLSSIKKQNSQCALTHFQSRRCSWGAGPRSSPASPSRPRWRPWWSRWSRRGGGSRGTSLLSSFWSVGIGELFSLLKVRRVCVRLSKCGGSFKEGGGGSTWWPVSRHKSYLSLAITSSYLYPGNSEKCAMLSNVQIRWGPKFSGLSWHRCKVEGVSTLHGYTWACEHCIGKVV